MNIEFSKWLISEYNYTNKSSRDANSRLKRAYSFFNIDAKDKSIDIQVELLTSNEDYIKLSPSVRSQLKRSLRLYKAFSDSKIND